MDERTARTMVHDTTTGEKKQLVEERERLVVGLVNGGDADRVGFDSEAFDCEEIKVSGSQELQEGTDALEAMTSRPDAASSPLVGSSRTSTRGRATIEHAMVTRRFCPPEMPRCKGVPILLLAISWSPSALSVASICSSILVVPRGSLHAAALARSSSPSPRRTTHESLAAYATVSRTVRTP